MAWNASGATARVVFDETHSPCREQHRCVPDHPVLRRRAADEVWVHDRDQSLGQPPHRQASATQNVDGEQVGVLNKLFGGSTRFICGRQRVKKWNRKVYYTLKYSLTIAILGLIVASALR